MLLCKVKRLLCHFNVDWTQNHIVNKQDFYYCALVKLLQCWKYRYYHASCRWQLFYLDVIRSQRNRYCAISNQSGTLQPILTNSWNNNNNNNNMNDNVYGAVIMTQSLREFSCVYLGNVSFIHKLVAACMLDADLSPPTDSAHWAM